MVDRAQVDHWVGRLVRVLVVFRALILLITLLLVPNYTPVIGLAGLAAAIVSYVPIRHWDRIAPTVARHPGYVAVEMLLATLIRAAAGARSSFFYFTLGTAAIVGVVYGRRGALPFSALLIALYELVALEGFPSMHPLHDPLSIVFMPALYPLAIGAGIAAREQIERGAATDHVGDLQGDQHHLQRQVAACCGRAWGRRWRRAGRRSDEAAQAGGGLELTGTRMRLPPCGVTSVTASTPAGGAGK